MPSEVSGLRDLHEDRTILCGWINVANFRKGKGKIVLVLNQALHHDVWGVEV
jgi:hypothetical protein